MTQGAKNIQVAAASTSNFASTYNNGTGGIGATLTATSTGTVTFDTILTVLNGLYLIASQSTPGFNGVYLCTTAGAVGVNAVFTRSTLFDTVVKMENTAFIYVSIGGLNLGGSIFTLTNAQTINIGTTGFNFGAIPYSLAVNAGFTTNALLKTNPNGQIIYITPVNNGIFCTTSTGVPQCVAPTTTSLASGSAVALVNATAKDVITVTGLTIGSKWIASGNVTVVGNTGTYSFITGWVSATSVTLPDSSLYQQLQPSTASAANNAGVVAPTQLLTVGASGNLFLSTNCGFTVGLSACGSITLTPG